jgi:HK97 family phage major capsid protein
MAEDKDIRKLRDQFNQVFEEMQMHAQEATERAGGDKAQWSDEDHEIFNRLTARVDEIGGQIRERQAVLTEETLQEVERFAKKPITPRMPIARSRDPLFSRSLELMSAEERGQVKPMYWRAFACLTWAGLKNGLEQYQGNQPRHNGFDIAIKHGVPRDVLERFRTGPSEEHRLAITDGAGLGGELVPDDFQAELSRDMAGYTSVIRAGATIRPTTGSVAVYPGFASATSDAKQYSTGFAGSWAAEGKGLSGGTAPTVQNKPATEQIQIPVHLWAPDAIEVTRELLEDTPLALEDELRQVIVETRGMDFDKAFLEGTGAGEPEGVTQSGATSKAYTTTDAGTKWESIVDLYVDLPQQYRDDPTAGFIMSSAGLGELLKLRSTTENMPFFVVVGTAPAGAVPMTLWGKPIYISEFMSSLPTTSSEIWCLFGAWRHYRIVERRDLMIQRLIERYVPNVGFFASSRVGGKVMRTAAFRLLTTA